MGTHCSWKLSLINTCPAMDNFEWTILPLPDFDTALARDPGGLGGELLAQIRNNGRLLDNFRFVIGGSSMISAEFSTAAIFPSSLLPATNLVLQTRPGQIQLRKNMLSSDWIDVIDKIRSRELLAGRAGSDDDNDDLLALIESLADKEGLAASIRWALGVGPDLRLELVLQALPASVEALNSKPQLKG
jgi:hypothetical protein